ncbi:hypothetical protein MRB53_020589 [Persea americana]|uniref:Uncharacterized protein n=1 Tax=Persea americana TaxID=3435 RepID=A0ACC2L1C1_PERAE|nr:hypothetical protein MRB53_020589 [Persea americana]
MFIGLLDTGVMQDHPHLAVRGCLHLHQSGRDNANSVPVIKRSRASFFIDGATTMLGRKVFTSPSDKSGLGSHTANTTTGAFV